MTSSTLPPALEHLDEIRKRADGRSLAVFLDYDGTLSAIVPRPEDAVMTESMRRAVRDLAEVCTVGVISGRDLADVRERVALDGIVYAGDHGFSIAGPGMGDERFEPAEKYLPEIRRVAGMLREKLDGVPGAQVEQKTYSLAVHYRNVDSADVERVERVVRETAGETEGLKMSTGRKIYEFKPNMDWDKGRALSWLLDALDLDPGSTMTIYVGDDTTDEDAFRELVERDMGLGLLVAGKERQSLAEYRLHDVDEVRVLLERLKSMAREVA